MNHSTAPGKPDTLHGVIKFLLLAGVTQAPASTQPLVLQSRRLPSSWESTKVAELHPVTLDWVLTLLDRLVGQALVLLGIRVDAEEKEWKQFVAGNGMTWAQYLDGGLTRLEARMFSTNAIPVSFGDRYRQDPAACAHRRRVN